MKQIFNISLLVIILSVPFALSSQTRKVIPAGRFEALSGIKNSRTLSATDSFSENDMQSADLFWKEVINYSKNNGKMANNFFTFGKLDPLAEEIFNRNGMKAVTDLKNGANLIFSDDFKRDLKEILSLKSGEKMIILKDKRDLKSVISNLSQFEVLLFQSNQSSNYFLLKYK